MAFAARYLPSDTMTVEEYLEYEKTAETKNEYAGGKLIPMSGTSLQHNEIAGNVLFAMEAQFGNGPCEAFIADIRLKTHKPHFRYPDIMALCGEPETDDQNPPCLLNPQVIVEVLSASTMLIDMNEKLDEYMALPTLTDYLIFAQDKMWARHHIKQDSATWTARTHTDPNAVLSIEALGITLRLADAYRKVKFETE